MNYEVNSVYRSTKWLDFIVVENKPKTVVLVVKNKQKYPLGIITYLSKWHQYVFTSEDQVIYNDGCLKAIAEVLSDLNKEQRSKSSDTKTSRKD